MFPSIKICIASIYFSEEKTVEMIEAPDQDSIGGMIGIGATVVEMIVVMEAIETIVAMDEDGTDMNEKMIVDMIVGMTEEMMEDMIDETIVEMIVGKTEDITRGTGSFIMILMIRKSFEIRC